MKNKYHLSKTQFLSVVKNTPLVSIDLIIKNEKGEILLGLRKNEPAKNYWFVPGGRIWKGETLPAAFNRISNAELGIDYHIEDAKLIGAFTHIYKENYFNVPKISTHYVVLGYELFMPEKELYDKINGMAVLSQHQSLGWGWLNGLKDIHPNSQVYFNL